MSNLFAFATARELSPEELAVTSPDTGAYEPASQTWVGGAAVSAVPCTVTNFYPYNLTTIGDYWTRC
ncbi:hypothetical protein ACFPM7_23620 [Actinokineospora guangxiensis]|uniref:Uncharacterized protein n=1 Tax=Actinokineospora guangxiensis TaxID=1490288 RepID=A0ABW0EV93_9PSEU